MKFVIALLGFTVLACAGVQAQVVVSHGPGPSQDCYVHARFDLNPLEGIKDCTIALGQPLTASDRAATFDNRGIILNRQGRFDDALSDFNQASTLRPELGDAYINIGSILIRKKSYEEALEQINKGIELGASFPHIGYYDRALALELLGRYKEAYYDYKKALELEPSFSLAGERLKDFVVTPTSARQSG